MVIVKVENLDQPTPKDVQTELIKLGRTVITAKYSNISFKIIKLMNRFKNKNESDSERKCEKQRYS